VDGNLELVALLAVNVPGFPVPRVALAASGQIEALILPGGESEWEAVLERLERLERMAGYLRPMVASAIRDRIVAGRG
jgi:hypothetical protein